MKVMKNAKIRNQYNQLSLLTQDTIRESDKNPRKHHTHESKELKLFPAGDHKATQYDQTHTKHKIQKRPIKEVPHWNRQ